MLRKSRNQSIGDVFTNKWEQRSTKQSGIHRK
jgi:hypothetical protein